VLIDVSIPSDKNAGKSEIEKKNKRIKKKVYWLNHKAGGRVK
jgi:hypothetical protein